MEISHKRAEGMADGLCRNGLREIDEVRLEEKGNGNEVR
jgi:hypothetical protein